MLTYIDLEIKNDPYRSGISIKSTARGASSGNVDSIVIDRKLQSSVYRHDGYMLPQSSTLSSQFNTLAVIPISKTEDFNFEVFDVLALSGSTYVYSVKVKSGNTTIEQLEVSDPITCSFGNLFVGDFSTYYIAEANHKTDFSKNIVVEYVQTLSGKYPMRVSNSNMNYYTGTCTGLFLEPTENIKSFVPDMYNDYCKKILEFLCDGEPKIIKTNDGMGWYVGINGTPRQIYNGFQGMTTIEFQWTEIDDFPTTGVGM